MHISIYCYSTVFDKNNSFTSDDLTICCFARTLKYKFKIEFTPQHPLNNLHSILSSHICPYVRLVTQFDKNCLLLYPSIRLDGLEMIRKH